MAMSMPRSWHGRAMSAMTTRWRDRGRGPLARLLRRVSGGSLPAKARGGEGEAHHRPGRQHADVDDDRAAEAVAVVEDAAQSLGEVGEREGVDDVLHHLG